MRYKPELTAFFIYTALFFVLTRFIIFVLPFIISLVISVVMKPLYDMLRRRFLFRSAFTATAISLLVFGALLAIAGFLLYLVALQAISLFERYGYLIRDYVNSPELFDSIRDSLLSGDLLSTVSDVAVSLFRVVPLAITFFIITFALTIFFLNNLSRLKNALLSRFQGEIHDKLSKAFSTAYMLVRRFIRSYLILYIITFIEAVFIFYLTGVDYPLAFAFITAVADVLPVLGPGTVYVPFAIIFILQKNYIQGITLLVFFLITIILRQILEPRIVSDTVKVHPLVIMAAIYFSIAAMDIWVLFYVVIMFLLFKVLRLSDVLVSKNYGSTSKNQ